LQARIAASLAGLVHGEVVCIPGLDDAQSLNASPIFIAQ
jgi:hypothetical protein